MRRKKTLIFHCYRNILSIDGFATCQDTGIPSKLIKVSAETFVNFLNPSFNPSITNSEFPSVLRQDSINLVFKKGLPILEITMDQLVSHKSIHGCIFIITC